MFAEEPSVNWPPVLQGSTQHTQNEVMIASPRNNILFRQSHLLIDSMPIAWQLFRREENNPRMRTEDHRGIVYILHVEETPNTSRIQERFLCRILLELA